MAAKVTAADRKKYGVKSGPHKGSFPIKNKSQASSAIKLRGRRKGAARSNILKRAAKFLPGKAQAARKKDASKKK